MRRRVSPDGQEGELPSPFHAVTAQGGLLVPLLDVEELFPQTSAVKIPFKLAGSEYRARARERVANFPSSFASILLQAQFRDRLEVYTTFLDIMKEFKSHTCVSRFFLLYPLNLTKAKFSHSSPSQH